MKTLKLSFLLLLMLLQTPSVFSQDLHYSQHVYNPLYYNPSLTGFIQQKARFNVNYSDRYRQSFGDGAMKTIFGSADMNFSLGGPYQKSFIGIGAYFFNQKRGFNQVNDNVAAISVSYRMLLDEEYKHSLSIGLQGSYWNRSFSFTDLQFGNQYDGLMYNPAQNSGEPTEYPSITRINAGTGIIYTYDSKDVLKGYIGASFFNLVSSNPNEETTNLPLRYNFHVGMDIDLNKTLITPSLLIDYQKDAMEVYTGVLASYKIVNNKTTQADFFAGPYLRMYKSPVGQFSLYTLNLLTGVTIDDWQIMFAIDNTLNSSKDALGGFNGFELSLQYKIGQSLPKSTPIYCPAFR